MTTTIDLTEDAGFDPTSDTLPEISTVRDSGLSDVEIQLGEVVLRVTFGQFDRLLAGMWRWYTRGWHPPLAYQPDDDGTL